MKAHDVVALIIGFVIGMIVVEKVNSGMKIQITNGYFASKFIDSNRNRIVCLIMTHPGNHETKARVVERTWAQKCNSHYFLTTEESENFPVMKMNFSESRANLIRKTYYGFLKMADYINDFEWFFKGDDDTFVIMENMKKFLDGYNPNGKYFFGRYFSPNGHYNSGGAGYVLSRGSLKVLLDNLDKNENCRFESGAEDAAMGLCLSSLGIFPSEARDSEGHEYFQMFSLPTTISEPVSNKKFWIHKWNHFPLLFGRDSCSQYSITFHYVSFDMMAYYDALLYRFGFFTKK